MLYTIAVLWGAYGTYYKSNLSKPKISILIKCHRLCNIAKKKILNTFFNSLFVSWCSITNFLLGYDRHQVVYEKPFFDIYREHELIWGHSFAPFAKRVVSSFALSLFLQDNLVMTVSLYSKWLNPRGLEDVQWVVLLFGPTHTTKVKSDCFQIKLKLIWSSCSISQMFNWVLTNTQNWFYFWNNSTFKGSVSLSTF